MTPPNPLRPTSWLLACALLGLAGCAAGPSEPLRYYQLREAPPPQAEAAPVAPTPPQAQHVWQIGRVDLPAYLDRDEMVLPTGRAGLQPQPGYRWAEPLREAVPRVLQADLGRLLGSDRVWSGAPPAGWPADRLLRVSITQFEPGADGRSVHLQARWVSTDAAGALVQVQDVALQVAAAGGDADALAAAHRAALWQLAQRIAQAERGEQGEPGSAPGRVTLPRPVRPSDGTAR